MGGHGVARWRQVAAYKSGWYKRPAPCALVFAGSLDCRPSVPLVARHTGLLPGQCRPASWGPHSPRQHLSAYESEIGRLREA